MRIRWSTTPNNTTCICLDCQKQGKQPCISHTAEGPVCWTCRRIDWEASNNDGLDTP